MALGAQLAEGAATDLDVVDAIYNYVVSHITYDYDKAASVQSGYLPDADEILSCGAGICFDYADVMAVIS